MGGAPLTRGSIARRAPPAATRPPTPDHRAAERGDRFTAPMLEVSSDRARRRYRAERCWIAGKGYRGRGLPAGRSAARGGCVHTFSGPLQPWSGRSGRCGVQAVNLQQASDQRWTAAYDRDSSGYEGVESTLDTIGEPLLTDCNCDSSDRKRVNERPPSLTQTVESPRAASNVSGVVRSGPGSGEGVVLRQP